MKVVFIIIYLYLLFKFIIYNNYTLIYIINNKNLLKLEIFQFS